MTPTIRRAVSFLVAVILTVVLAVPAFAEAVDAPDESKDQTANSDIIRNAALSYRLKDEGDSGEFHQLNAPYQIEDASKISAYQANYTFLIADHYDEASGKPNRTVSEGDYYVIDLPKEIEITNPTDGTISREPETSRNGITDTIASYAFVKVDGHWQIKVTFSELVNDPNELEIQGGMVFDFSLDLNAVQAGKTTNVVIPIDNEKNIILSVTKPVPPPTTPTKVEKSVASYDEETRELTWDIKISPESGVFEGCTFEDVLTPSQCELVSITHGAVLDTSEYSYDPGTGSLSYKIPEGRNGKEYATIQITVKVKAALYNSLLTTTISNQATLSDVDRLETPLLSNTATQEIKPGWLKKEGTPYEGNQIKWTLTVNSSKQSMYNAVVIDHLQDDVTFDQTSLAVDGKTISVHAGSYTPSNDTEIYALLVDNAGKKDLQIYFERGRDNASTKQRAIQLVTDIKRPDTGADKPEYRNTAEMTADFGDGTGVGHVSVSPADLGMTAVGVPHASVTKKANSITAENKSLGTIDWSIVAVSNLAEYGKSELIDVIPDDQDFVEVKLGDTLLTEDSGNDVYYSLAGNTLTVHFDQANAMDAQQKLTLTTKIKADIYGTNLSQSFKNNITVNLYDQTNASIVAKNTASNNVWISNTVIEKKVVRYSGNDTKAGQNPRMNFEITINKNQMPLTDVSVLDDLKQIVTEYKKTGGAYEIVDGVVWNLVNGTVKIERVAGSKDAWKTNDLTPVYEDNCLTVDFGGTLQDCYRIKFTAELDLTQNEVFQENGSIRCSGNIAQIRAGGLKDGQISSKPTPVSDEISNTILGKLGEQSKENAADRQVVWTISLNQHKQKLQTTKVIDVLQEGLALDPTSLKLYKNVIDANGNFKTGSALAGCTAVDTFKYTYELAKTPEYAGRYVLTVELPDDQTDYVLQFATDVDKSLLGKEISNSAYFSGTPDAPQNNSVSEVQVSAKPGGSSTRKASITVNGRSSDTDKELGDTEFSLYWIKNGEKIFVRTLKAADDGSVTFYGLTKGEKYEIVQSDTADDYQLDSKKPIEFTAAENLEDLNFYSTPEKTGSWTPAATKQLNKAIDHPFSFVLKDGDKTVMNGQSGYGNAKTKEEITFTLVDGVSAENVLTFTDAHTFAKDETEYKVASKDFTLSEADLKLPGYTADASSKTIQVDVYNVKGQDTLKLVVTDEKGTVLTDEAGQFLMDQIPVFNNTYDAAGALTLTGISKLDGHTLADGDFTYELYEGTDPDDSGKLLERVTNGAGSSVGETSYEGAIAFQNLAYKLADIGVHTYTVIQKQAVKPGYTLDEVVYTIEVTVTDLDDGTLKAEITKCTNNVDTETTHDLKFNNQYRAEDANTSFDSTVSLSGRTLEEGQFEFILNTADPDGTVTGTVSEHLTHDGEGNLTCPELNYTQKDIGKKFYYQLSQKSAGNPGYTYDDTVYTVMVEVLDGNDGTLVLKKTVEANGKETLAQFHNRYHAEGTLKIQAVKELNGKTLPEDQFGFQLTSASADGTAEATAPSQTVRNLADGSIIFPEMSFDETSAGMTYYFRLEELNENKAGYTYDETVYVLEVDVTDNGNGTLNVAQRIASPEGAAELRFTNDYMVSDTESSFLTSVTLTGRALEENQFTVEMKQTDENGMVLEELDSQTNDAVGQVNFKDRTYTQDDMGEIFYYTVTQVNDGKQGYTYDESTYLVKEEIVDQLDGTLEVAQTVTKDGEETKEIRFDNEYKTSSVSFAVTGTKKLDGRVLSVGEFEFVLADENRKEVQMVSNDSSGNFAFDALVYTQKELGEHRYTVVEKTGKQDGVTYDQTAYELLITVTDNGDGTLSAVQTIEKPEKAEQILFQNSFQAAEQPTVSGTGTGITPSTGDSNNFVGIITILLLAAGCGTLLVRRRGK